MLILMNADATPAMIKRVCEEVVDLGLTPHPIKGLQRTVINVTGNKYQVNADRILTLDGVHDIVIITKPYKLVSRESHPEDSHIDIGAGVIIGGPEFVVMAGPCSVESREQCFKIAEYVAKKGARVFRGGAFKPRTSPYSFQGLGEEGLKILAEVREKFGLLIVTEAVDTETLDMVGDYTDIIQIGARNMQNYSLLRKAGRTNKPILIKRGMSASLDEFLMAAEYVMVEGNPRVILCERGVRTFSNHNRNVLDLSAVTYVKKFSHLPIIADPSHGSGQKYKVVPLSRASLAAGADGLLVEVHHEPEKALSDGPQAITLTDFENLMSDVKKIAVAIGRTCK
ncbi:MAG: 3-deoxy-7-phosphoheptulonate synthase [candidate division Zixibacteria bacterium]|nr:3-deoxy-7-phosphoheptulonate synthase [candidate division Zixibacteria bacterium]